MLSPFEGNDTAWMFVSENKLEAVVIYISVLQEPNAPLSRFQLRGLDEQLSYDLEGYLTGTFSGDQLMYAGLPRPHFYGDFQSAVIRFCASKFI